MYRKKLIEVALPLEAINVASAREKSIRHGHPSTLHLWWARRPLAACRAVLFASLVDDPSAWPELFPTDEAQNKERERLHRIIEELVVWENSNDDAVLLRAQTEIARSVAQNNGDQIPEGAKAIREYLATKAPPVLDPFCGGGSIPLEAQRLGLRAYASDLNPVAVLITKALIEIPPKFAGMAPVNPDVRMKFGSSGSWKSAAGLAEDVRYYGQWMRDEAEKRIGHLYPKVTVTAEMTKRRPDLKRYVGKELTVIAWLWARTVPSPNPVAKGAHVPLVRSFWISTKGGKEAWVEPIIDKKANTYRFEVHVGIPPKGTNPRKGTVERTGATCILTQTPMSLDHVRNEGRAGRMSSRLLAVVCEGVRSRVYMSPDDVHEKTARTAEPKDYPDTDIPLQALGFRVRLYGMDKHHKLFTARQLVALTTLSDLAREARLKVMEDSKLTDSLPDDERTLEQGGLGSVAYGDAIITYLALGIDRLAMTGNNLVRWNPVGQKAQHAFGRQALPMIWDYAEPNFFADATGSISASIELLANPLELLGKTVSKNHISIQVDASNSAISHAESFFSTDPPYYDNIGYADLSDFFYVWLRRTLIDSYEKLFSTLLTPKVRELIASPYRHDGDKEKAKEFFEHGLGNAFQSIRQSLKESYPLTVFYAFKQAEGEDESDDEEPDIGVKNNSSTGWETMLAGLMHAGFTINGTWPLRTEMKTRQVAMGTNALASSIVLVCHGRDSKASLSTRREFISALKQELPRSLRELQRGNIAPVDLAQSAIGPGMAIFTRYAKVLETDGSAMSVRIALQLINQTLDEVLAEQEGEFDGDTRWALAWFEQYGMEEGLFGVAETLSKAKNTAVNALVEAGIIHARAGKVRLLKRDDLPDDWDPASDNRLTIWEVVQHIIRTLEQKGEEEAAALVRRLGGTAETARDLAYRLYTICERKKWAQEALAYNGVVIAWPEITRLASGIKPETSKDKTLFEQE